MLDVDWSAVSSVSAAGSRSFSPPAARSASLFSAYLKKLSKVKLPVYLPATIPGSLGIDVVTDTGFYDVTVHLKGATLFVSGDRFYQQVESSPDAILRKRAKSEANPEFIRAEGLIETDFHRHGVNYSLSIECEQPEEDSRCKSPVFLKQVYRGLKLSGGQK
jgi:hypothetical protein